MRILAAQPRARWTAGAEHIAQRAGIPATLVRSALASMVRAWNTDVRKAAKQAMAGPHQTKQRAANQRTATPTPHYEQVTAGPSRRPETERSPARPRTPDTGIDR